MSELNQALQRHGEYEGICIGAMEWMYECHQFELQPK